MKNVCELNLFGSLANVTNEGGRPISKGRLWHSPLCNVFVMTYPIPITSRPDIHDICQFCSTEKTFWVTFCFTQKRVNRDKINFSSKQRKSQQNGFCVNSTNHDDTDVEQNFLTCGAIFLHMTSKNIHVVEQNCFSGWAIFPPQSMRKFSCVAKLLHMKIFAPPKNIMYGPEAHQLHGTNKIIGKFDLKVDTSLAFSRCTSKY